MSQEVDIAVLNTNLTNIQSGMEKGFEEMKSRQDYTNGKVIKNSEWRLQSMGALAVITLILLPILTWAIYTLVNIDSHIDMALQAYNIDYE